MQVGVLQFFSWPKRDEPLPRVYERAMERVRTMDQNPYEAIWLAEHHFSTYSVCPSVHMMGTHIAAHTKNLRIGTGVTLAAFYNPLRIAEEIALLDVLSGGRVNFGAGPGFDRKEFEAFGVPRDESKERFREAVAAVLAAWTQETLHFEGAYFQAEGIEVLPRPVQQPHPPTWLTATSEASALWAAERGYSILMDPHSTHSEIGRKRAAYFDTLRANGHPTEGRVLPTARLTAIAETDERALAIARRAAEWTVASYMGAPITTFRDDGKELDPVDHYLNNVIIHGCPERVRDQLLQLEQDVPLDYLLLSPLSEETFRLFNDRVLEHVAETPLSATAAGGALANAGS